MEKEPTFEQKTENAEEEKFNTLHEKWENIMKKDGISFYNKCADFSRKIRQKYPDAETYQLFHLLAGSTFDKDDAPNFDFPGEDSIEKFIEEAGKE